MSRHRTERRIAIVCALGLVACVLIAASCGFPYPDADGAHFAWQSPQLSVGMLPGSQADFFTPEVFDVSGWHMVHGLADLGVAPAYVLIDALASARVEGHEHAFTCLGGDGKAKCDGQQLDMKLLIATHLDVSLMCVWETALMHEMAHLLLEQATGDADPGHVRADVWPLTGVRLGECP